MHVLLTNRSTHPVYPVGAALEVKIADEWYWAGRLARYQVDELAEITITDGNSGKWAFRVSPEHVTALLESRVEHGAPLAGLLVFHLNNRSIPMIEAGGSASIDEYRLVITDVFGKKHSIEADRAETETFSSGDVSLVEMLHETGVPSRRVEAGTDNGPAPD
ncbi:hypothetical protein [Streptomyces sp. NPDC002889]|uniref:hypothetical protein n=1 Tax=Streptomyces sp. NPDC002889 TaxID=3364669 RepID=UPI003683FBF7